MPIVLAFLLALMLTPIVRFLRKRGVPEALSATLLVFMSMTAIGTTGYFLSGPVVELANDAPAIGQRLTERLEDLRRPFERFMEVSRQVDEAADTTSEPDVQRVVVSQPGIVSRAAGNLLSGSTTAAITFVLSLFLLASGTMFYEKIIQSFTRLSEKKRALRVVYDVEREISRYLLTVAAINTCLGIVVGTGLWALGMPMPFVFGVAAGLLNFLPYVGAAMTIILVAVLSIVTFDSLAYALVPPAFVLLCNIIEGEFRQSVDRRSQAGDQCGRNLHRRRLLVVALGLRRRADCGAAARRHQSILRSFREPQPCRQLPVGPANGRGGGREQGRGAARRAVTLAGGIVLPISGH